MIRAIAAWKFPTTAFNRSKMKLEHASADPSNQFFNFHFGKCVRSKNDVDIAPIVPKFITGNQQSDSITTVSSSLEVISERC